MPAFVSRIPILGWVLGAIAAYGIYRGKEELDEARGRRQQQRADEKRARRVQVKLQEENNEKLAQAERARDDFSARPISTPRRMSDRARAVLTRRARRSS